MPNLIQLSQTLQGMPDQYLSQEAQSPSGVAPPYLILAELGRRQALRQSAAAPPTSTVYDDIVGPMRSIDSLNQPQPSRAPVTGGPPMAPPPPMMAGPPPTGLGAMPPSGAMPMRMAKGGIVRMQYGGAVGDYGGYFDPYKLIGTWNPPQPTYAGYARGGGDLYGGGAVQPVRKPLMYGGIALPEYPAPTPREPYTLQRPEPVKEPDFATVLNEIKRNREQFGPPTAPYADRIKELEEERRKIRGPSKGEALMNLGLGIMGSRATSPFQALGESGVRALAGYQEDRQRAETQRLSLADRLASLRQREAESEAQRQNKDFDLAGDLQQKRYSTAMVNAQNAASFANQEATLRREELRQAQQDERARAEYGLRAAELAGRPRQTENIDPNSEAGILAHGRKVELSQAAEERHRRPLATGTGLGAFEKAMSTETAIRNAVKPLINEQLSMIRTDDPKAADAAKAYDLARDRVIRNLQNTDEYIGMSPIRREKLINAVISSEYKDTDEERVTKYLKSPTPQTGQSGQTTQTSQPKAQTAKSPDAPTMTAQPPRAGEPTQRVIDLIPDNTRNRSVAPPPAAPTAVGVPITQAAPVTTAERMAALQAQNAVAEQERAAQMARLGQQTQAAFQAALPKADVRKGVPPSDYPKPEPGETTEQYLARVRQFNALLARQRR